MQFLLQLFIYCVCGCSWRRDQNTKGVFEELKSGMRAVVTLGNGEEENTAVELRYSEAAAAKK